MRSPRSGKVSASGRWKIETALRRGWTPVERYGPGEFLRLRRRRRTTP